MRGLRPHRGTPLEYVFQSPNTDFGTELPKRPPAADFWVKLPYCLILAEIEGQPARKLGMFEYRHLWNIDGGQKLGLTFEPFLDSKEEKEKKGKNKNYQNLTRSAM